MKKVFKILISLILVVVTSFGVACGGDAGQVENYENPRKIDKVTFQGIHTMTAEEVETEDYIIKNGNLEYQILMPVGPTEYETTAYNEFRLLLKRAMGNIPVSIVYDDQVTEFNENEKYISIGMTKLVDLANVDYDAELLSYNGARIVTVGKSIFLIGGTWFGVCNAVYDFFNICFNYEIYTKNCIEIDTNVQNLKLRNFDVTDIPDVEFNLVTHGPLHSYRAASSADYRALLTDNLTKEDVNNEIYNSAIRMRYNNQMNNGICNLVSGYYNGVLNHSNCHTSVTIASSYNQNRGDDNPIYEGEYMNTNIQMTSDWYSGSANQLCYTAHGKEDVYEDMVKFFSNYFIWQYKNNPPSKAPGCDYVALCAEDGGGYCTCEHCEASKASYGGFYAGTNIEFCNAVAERIEEWMNRPENAEYKRENFRVLTFAYDQTKEAPAYYDEEAGKYVTYNDLVLSEHLCIWNTRYPLAYTDIYDIDQADKMDNMVAWGDISEHMWVWDYSHHYSSGAFFLDNINGFSADRVQHMASMDVELRFTEVHSTQEVITTWFDLTTYMISKQTWNSNYEASELIENYFNAMYGPAAKTMLRLYYDQKIFTQQMYEQHEARTNSIMPNGFSMWTPEHYPFQVLNTWVQQTEKALQEIETYKYIDMDQYETYRDRIDIESMQYFFVINKLYDSSNPPYTIEEKERYKERFLRILDNYKVTWTNASTIRAW